MLLLVVSAFSCKKKKDSGPVTGDYVIVGSAGGFMAGGIPVPYYLITSTQLKKAEISNSLQPPTDITGFDFNTVLPDARFQEVKGLKDEIPSELLSMNGADIGGPMPDVGYTDIRASVKGVVYRWKFENNLSASSLAVQNFVADAHKVYQ